MVYQSIGFFLKKDVMHLHKTTQKTSIDAILSAMAKMCPKAGACGACAYNGVKYSKQLERKQAYVEDLLLPFGPVAPILGMEHPFFYRNKVQSVFGYSQRGEVVSGIYREGTH